MLFGVNSILKKWLPIFQWGSDYKIDKAISDLIAGITVGLTLIPQSIAYASLAGLDPQYGLYSSLCGGLIYVVFGTIPELNIAPTALLSLLTFSYTHNVSFGNVQAATLLCLLSGIIELICGLLHLGFLIDFVSIPVVAAFTSAGAITIASSQIKNLLGVKFSAENFISVWTNVISHIRETKKWDCLLGIICCVILLSMRKLKDFGSPPLEKSNGNGKEDKTNVFKKIVWFVSVARNAFVVIGCAVIAYLLGVHELKPFSQTSQIDAGWPNVSLPAFQIRNGNETVMFSSMLKELGSGILVVPFVAILGNVAIAKSFAHGKVVDASQEMIAVGLCNIFGSFFGSYPVNASFSRAAVSSASGVRTPCAGIYTGIMVILAFTFLTPYFSFIPKATLAAVIICAVLFMIEVQMIKKIWKMNKIDIFPFFITLIFCLLLGIEIGILIGICIDVLKLLYNAARPKIVIEKIKLENGHKYVKCTPTTSLFFPSAEYLREKIIRTKNSDIDFEIYVIDFTNVNKLDFTALQCLAALVDDLRKIEKKIVFILPNQNIFETLSKLPNIENVEKCNSEKELLLNLNNLIGKITVDKLYSSSNVTQNIINDVLENDKKSVKNVANTDSNNHTVDVTSL